MRYRLILPLLAVLLCSGCGNVKVSGALNQSTFAGTVSIVRLTVTNDGTQVTVVTLISGMASQELNFCGNVVNQFPMNSMVQGSFTPGNSCSTIVQVTIKG